MRAKSLTQRGIAARTGMPHSYVNDVLQGRVMPSIPQCERLARAVDLSLPWLFDDPERFIESLGLGSAEKSAT